MVPKIYRLANKSDERKLVEYIKENPDKINKSSSSGKTALHNAVKRNRLENVKTLVSNRADVNAVDKSGETPLHYSVKLKDTTILAYLLRNNANPNIKSKDWKRTPLFRAARWNKDNHVKLLLQFGADPLILDFKGKTPLHYASHSTTKTLLMRNDNKLKDQKNNCERITVMDLIKQKKWRKASVRLVSLLIIAFAIILMILEYFKNWWKFKLFEKNESKKTWKYFKFLRYLRLQVKTIDETFLWRIFLAVFGFCIFYYSPSEIFGSIAILLSSVLPRLLGYKSDRFKI